MSDVFLSYSKEDVGTARLISGKLTEAGFSVWWDRQIMPGKTWDEVIGVALEAASCIIVLWSSVSVKSRWVREEAERGADRGLLVPILIEKVDPPFGFGRIEAADLSDWHGEADNSEFVNLCDAIHGLVKNPKPRVAAPVKEKPAPAAAAPPVMPQQNNPPYPSPQFFLGRWRVDGMNGASDIIYFPDGSFSGVMVQNIAGFANPMNVFGRWNLEAVGPNVFRLQLWFANMTTWGGNFRILDVDHIQNLEMNYVAARVG